MTEVSKESKVGKESFILVVGIIGSGSKVWLSDCEISINSGAGEGQSILLYISIPMSLGTRVSQPLFSNIFTLFRSSLEESRVFEPPLEQLGLHW